MLSDVSLAAYTEKYTVHTMSTTTLQRSLSDCAFHS
jgi:hypothetical protein